MRLRHCGQSRHRPWGEALLVLANLAIGCGGQALVASRGSGARSGHSEESSSPDSSTTSIGSGSPTGSGHSGETVDSGGGVLLPAGDASAVVGAGCPFISYGPISELWSTAVSNVVFGSVALDRSGNEVIAGSAEGPVTVAGQTFPAPPNTGGRAGPFLLTLDAEGKPVSYRIFSGAGVVNAVATDSVGDIFIAGDVVPGGRPVNLGTAVQGPSFLAKLDATGALLWDVSLGGATSLATDAAGDVAIVGDGPIANQPAPTSTNPVMNPIIGEDPYQLVAVFSPDGNLRYARQFDALALFVSFDAAGNLFLSGTFDGTLDIGAPAVPIMASTRSSFVAMLNPTGAVQWARMSNGGAGLAATSGVAFLAGAAPGTVGPLSSTSAPFDLYVASVDGTGQATFERNLPAAGDSVEGVAADPNGGAVLAGWLDNYVDFGGGFLPPAQLFLAKVDGQGNPVFSAAFPSVSVGTAPSVHVTASGDVVVGGTFVGAPPATQFSMGVARFTQAAAGGTVAPNPMCIPSSRTTYSEVKYMTLDSANLYFATNAEVFAQPLAGGPATLLAATQDEVSSLAVGDGSVFWSNSGPSSFEPADFPPDIMNQGAVVSSPIAGGTPGTLALSQDAPGPMALDDAAVYWMAGNTTFGDAGPSAAQILSVPLGGGTVHTLLSGMGSPYAIAAGHGLVAFASQSGAGATISVLPREGGTPTMLATTERSVAGIALDATNVYWTEASSPATDISTSDGSVRFVPLAGGMPTTLASGQTGPGPILVVGSTLFWSTASFFDNFNSSNNAAIWSLPVAGGRPTAVVNNGAEISAFTVDAAHVAWADGSGTHVVNR
jgi:hypothetical protein